MGSEHLRTDSGQCLPLELMAHHGQQAEPMAMLGWDRGAGGPGTGPGQLPVARGSGHDCWHWALGCRECRRLRGASERGDRWPAGLRLLRAVRCVVRSWGPGQGGHASTGRGQVCVFLWSVELGPKLWGSRQRASAPRPPRHADADTAQGRASGERGPGSRGGGWTGLSLHHPLQQYLGPGRKK